MTSERGWQDSGMPKNDDRTIGRPWRTRVQGHILEVLGDGATLIVCGQFVPGISLTWAGLPIAVAVISGPLIAIGEYLDWPRAQHWGTAFLLALLWVSIAPAVVEAITPDLHIAGVWQYLVLLAVLYLSATSLGRLLTDAKRILARVH